MQKFNVGDTVKIVKNPVKNFMTSEHSKSLIGYSGIIKCKNLDINNYSIEFKENLPYNLGHDCDGMCKNGHGLFISEKYLEKVEEKEMTKSDLKVNDIVTLRNRVMYIIMELNGNLFLVNDGEFMDLDKRYSENMESNEEENFAKRWDVITVRRPEAPYQLKHVYWTYAPIIYDRKDVMEVTMKEIEEKFGCKVKIIREED